MSQKATQKKLHGATFKMYTMTDCNNKESVGMDFVGTTDYLQFTEYGNFLFGNMYSSSIQNVTEDDNTIVVETMNTIYTFTGVQNEKSRSM